MRFRLPVATCCYILGVVDSNLKLLRFFMQQLGGQTCIMLRPTLFRYVVAKCCDRLAVIFLLANQWEGIETLLYLTEALPLLMLSFSRKHRFVLNSCSLGSKDVNARPHEMKKRYHVVQIRFKRIWTRLTLNLRWVCDLTQGKVVRLETLKNIPSLWSLKKVIYVWTERRKCMKTYFRVYIWIKPKRKELFIADGGYL